MAGGLMGLSQRAFRDSEIEFEHPGLFIHQPWQALVAQVNNSTSLPACLFTISLHRMSVNVELQSWRWSSEAPQSARVADGDHVMLWR